MGVNIAVAGKGGTGKTSVTSLIIRYLIRHNLGTILAVDADPNSNLAENLGLEVRQTVGRILNQFQGEKLKIPAGTTKEAYLEYQLNVAITESKGLDLITMGRGEGPECYCYPNVVIRKLIDDWSKNYAFVVMDNEAGLEHLSRRTTQNVDELLLVSDHSVKGLRAVARVRELVAELKLGAKRESVIINMVPGEIDPLLQQELDRLGIVPTAVIPVDEDLKRFDLEQKPLFDLPDTSPAVTAVNDLMDRLLKTQNVEMKRG
ncbi:MAG TPA: AAA family ATPase [Dehalococcoidales bacterium]|nr:MAG: carbon monoxide dehydrogenase [Chloroflexi bacterium RBG_16_60_22]HJX12358.1 AAA family ATPase [Dehalococcoidales bacterium]